MLHTHHKAPPAPVTALAAAMVGVLLAGCAPGSQPAHPQPAETVLPATPAAPPAATTPGSRPDPLDDPQQQALDAYVGMQDAYLEATRTGNPDHPDLPRYAAADALQRLQAAVAAIRDQGLRGRGQATHQPQIQSLNPVHQPATITIRDCLDTIGTELYDPTGRPYQDEPGGLRLVIATVKIIDGAWKVTGVGIHEVGTCTRTG
jgi:hypothetical protein